MEILKIIAYTVVSIVRLTYISLLFIKYYIVLWVRWRISLYRAKKYISKLSFDKTDTDEVVKNIVGSHLSLKGLYRIFKESIGI